MERGCGACGKTLTSAADALAAASSGMGAAGHDDDDDGSEVEESEEGKEESGESEGEEGEESEESEEEDESEVEDGPLPLVGGSPKFCSNDLTSASALAWQERMKTSNSPNYAIHIDETALSNFTSNSNNPKC